MGWTFFLVTYVLGGLTFLPLLVLAVFAHGYYTFPDRPDLDPSGARAHDDIVQPGDDESLLKAAGKLSREEARARTSQNDGDVAAGYFAVCREYAPMGINAKPIERTTPVGSTTVAAPSQSVYQTMYRSIFDRKQPAGPLDNKNGSSQRPKKAGNVFYVVLRHGHMMLFDDDEQLEVRHVISLAHHDVSIFSGEDEPTPEGELYIKKNAICLTRKPGGPDMTAPDAQASKPFYLFSENCSAKEDFYFSLLRNQEQSFRGEQAGAEAPIPSLFDVKHIISLVQKLHSHEDQMHTRWLNALIGRLFLAIYRTKDLENMIREKLVKKIARVKRPSFLTSITIQRIETGDSAPYITNPRLKDLTVEGECGAEADIKYTGNFRIEVAATVRIDLGSRFKAREVNLVLAVVLHKLEGHVLFKIKPPPSNRIWFSFQTMPKMEMTLEPIISSKQITYTVILRQIESRIKEVIAETLVLPFWDDTPFFNTEHKKWRGGIFDGDDAVVSTTDLEAMAAEIDALHEAEKAEETAAVENEMPPMEKSHSMPVLEQTSTGSTGLFGLKLNGKSSASQPGHKKRGSISSSNSVDPKPSITGPSSPTVGTDAANADIFKPATSPTHESLAAQAIAHLSRKTSRATSPCDTSARPKLLATKQSSPSSRSSSREATDSDKDLDVPRVPDRRHTVSSTHSGKTVSSTNSGKTDEDNGTSPAPSARGSIKSQTQTLTRNFFLRNKSSHDSLLAPTDSPKRSNAIAAMTTAATVAKRWGLTALQRNTGNGEGSVVESADPESPLDLSKPMGGGRPLPPPGQPLPMPDKKKVTSIPVPKRRPLAPPPHPHMVSEERETSSSSSNSHASAPQRPPPPLPKRRMMLDDMSPARDGGLLVVEAPNDSEPTTPLSESGGFGRSWMEEWGRRRGRSPGARSNRSNRGDEDSDGVEAWMEQDREESERAMEGHVGVAVAAK